MVLVEARLMGWNWNEHPILALLPQRCGMAEVFKGHDSGCCWQCAVVVPLCGTSVGAGMVPAVCMQSVCMGRQWKTMDDISSSKVVVVQDQPLDGWEDLKVAAVAFGTGTRFC